MTHPDGQYSVALTGPAVAAAGGYSTQLSPTSAYGVGYPVLSLDEAGLQRQEWLDGFGRIIEVDEPPSGQSLQIGAPAAGGTASVSLAGAEEYSGAGAATAGTISLAIEGADAYITTDPCEEEGDQNSCPQTIYDYGTISVTVNGFTAVANYGNGNAQAVAANVAAALNVASSPVTATVNGLVVTLMAKATGSCSNYSISYSSATSDPTDFNGASFGAAFYCSPALTAKCSTLIGGSSALPGAYDSGLVWITVNGTVISVPYQQGSDAPGLAGQLAGAVNSGGYPFTAAATGATLQLTASETGVGSNYSLSAGSATSLPSTFALPSFSASVSGPTFIGGADAIPSTTMANSVPTLYTYDAANNLTQVVQGVQTRTFTYDGIGRRTSANTPEKGTENYYYTTSQGSFCSGDPSKVCRIKDARNVTTTFTYDSMNRLTGKSYSDTTSPVTFSYDQGAFAVGRLSGTKSGTETESYQYDQIGRVTQVSKTFGGTIFKTGYAYNVGGEITSLTYPSGRQVQQSFDAVGNLCEIAPQTNGCGSAPSPYATGLSYDGAGNPLGFKYGNNVVAFFSYSPLRSQLASVSYTQGPQTFFSLKYSYAQDSTNCPTGSKGNNGNIQCITDNVENGRSAAYSYDTLGRLATAQTEGSAAFPQWGYSWNYDQYGNRTAQNVTAGQGFTSLLSFGAGAKTNQPDGMCFDASGNLLAKSASPCPPAFPTYSYDAENRLTSYGGATQYAYDAQSIRLQKTTDGTTTNYIESQGLDLAEYPSGAMATAPTKEYIYIGSSLLATITGGTTTYSHADHLSVRVNTDGTVGSPTFGQVVGAQGHFPFGEAWYSSNTTTKFIFTGYERDAESGLDYALARYYDSSMGRFCSADPLEGTPGDPQSWNRYAYVRNNPVNITDPSGESWLSWFVDAVIGLIAVLSIPFTGGGSIIMDFESGDIAAAVTTISTSAATAAPGVGMMYGFGQVGSAYGAGGMGASSFAGGQQAPKGYIPCPPVLFTIKAPAPGQAKTSKGGAAGIPNVKAPGNVAYNPSDYGLSTADAHALDRSNTPILFSPDWSTAQIPNRNGGYSKPAPTRGMPQVPTGLPVSQDTTLQGRDTLGGVGKYGNSPNTIDMYGYGRANAQRATRDVMTTVYLPAKSGANCPQGNR